MEILEEKVVLSGFITEKMPLYTSKIYSYAFDFSGNAFGTKSGYAVEIPQGLGFIEGYDFSEATAALNNTSTAVSFGSKLYEMKVKKTKAVHFSRDQQGLIDIDGESEIVKTTSRSLELYRRNDAIYNWMPSMANRVLETSGTSTRTNAKGTLVNEVTVNDILSLIELYDATNLTGDEGVFYVSPGYASMLRKLAGSVMFTAYTSLTDEMRSAGVIGTLFGKEVIETKLGMFYSAYNAGAKSATKATFNSGIADPWSGTDLLEGMFLASKSSLFYASKLGELFMNEDAKEGTKFFSAKIYFLSGIMDSAESGVVALIDNKA